MKIILNPHEGATRADLIALVSAAQYALEIGIERERPGHVMAITRGIDRDTYGVIRRKGSVSVYPPARTRPAEDRA